MTLTIDDFPAAIIKFPALKITNSSLLWHNKDFFSNVAGDIGKKLIDDCSYAIEGNEFFDELIFDASTAALLTAEKYGGQNIGRNGGGGRCGNINGYQLKGIGKNPLVSSRNDSHWHSYGGLNLVEAMYETIYAYALGKILPIGVARVYGLILTGKKTALLPGLEHKPLNDRRGYGAILIREPCLRPGHFMLLPKIDPILNSKTIEALGQERVHANAQRLLTHCKSQDDFILQMADFLSNHANQFAFSRAVRIAHGSVSASNVCLDGRWLDLANTSFLQGGKNFQGLSTFHEEPETLLDAFIEFIQTVSICNNFQLDIDNFRQLFNSEFDYYSKIHIGYVFGLNSLGFSDVVNLPYFQSITDLFFRVATLENNVSVGRCFAIDEYDPVLSLMEFAFLLQINASRSAHFFDSANLLLYGVEFSAAEKNFSNMFSDLYRGEIANKISYKSYIVLTAISAIKRAYLAEYFFMGRLEGYIYSNVLHDNNEDFSLIMDESTKIADWAFDLNEVRRIINSDLGCDIVVFRHENISLLYSPHRECYLLSKAITDDYKIFSSINDALSHINTDHSVNGFNFSKYLKKLITIIGD